MQPGMNVETLKKVYMDFYDVTPTQLDKGIGINPCLYMHKSFFRYNDVYLPQDFSKVGKANSIYNRMRGQSQSGADVRLLWNIEVKTPFDADRIEDKFKIFACQYNVDKDTAYGTELYEFDTFESITILNSFVEYESLQTNPAVIRINIYYPDHRYTIFERSDLDKIPTYRSKYDNTFGAHFS